MKKIFLSIVLATCLCILTACGKTSDLVGKWEGKTNDGLTTIFEFKKDGKVIYSNEFGFESNGTYKIDNDKVTISLELWSEDKVYEFVIEDKKLSLIATDIYSPSYTDMVKK